MLFLAGMAGFEPADEGVKVPCLTPWRHPRILYFVIKNGGSLKDSAVIFMGWIIGLEPTTSRATIWRASQLRHTHHIKYNRAIPIVNYGTSEGTRTPGLLLRRQLLYPAELQAHTFMERVMGVEPTQPAWKAGILPLNYTRVLTTWIFYHTYN